MVSDSALQLETCYGVISLPYIFIFAKLSIRQNGSFSCSCEALLQPSVNIQTRAKEYTNVDISPILEDMFVPSRDPLEILHLKINKISRMHKETLRHTPHNPHMKVSHNYSIMDDLA